MNFGKALADHEMKSAGKPDGGKAAANRTVMIAPVPVTVSSSDVLATRVCVEVQDLIAAQEGEVLLFSEQASELLRMTLEFRELLGLTVVALIGLPDADYAPWFSTLTWQVDQVSYSSVLSEMSVEEEAARVTAEKAKSVHDRERDRVSRSDGTVRKNDNFSEARLDDASDEDDDHDDED